MSELGETLHRMRLAEDGTPIRGTITQVDAFGQFSSGWIGQDFLYETPELFITCETEFGEIQLESHIRNIEESGILQFLEESDEITLTEQVTLESLVGTTIFIAPDDERFQATISTDSNVQYTEEENVIFRTDTNLKNLEDIEIDGRFETGLEPKPIEWMNNLLTTEYHRKVNGDNGWIEVPFNYYGQSNGHHFFAVTLPSGNKAYWAFETHISGVENIDTFLSELGIEYTPDEFESETIWVKPLRDLHFTNRPDSSLRIDTDEFWVIDEMPRIPEKNKTFVEKIKDFFSVSSDSIDVSVSRSRDRRAKSSQTKDSLRPAHTTLDTKEKIKELA